MNRWLKMLFLSVLLLLAAGKISQSRAEISVEVTGNGSGSENNIQVENSTTETLNQANDAQVNNDIEAVADTGESQANDNTDSQVNIATGEINSEVHVSNQLNQSIVRTGCCTQEIQAVVTGNGADSQNTVTINQEKNTQVNINQQAKVINLITLSADTGDNQANENNGSVKIDTGSISAAISLANQVNNAYGLMATGLDDVNVKVVSNGVGSVNQVVINLLANLLVNRDNRALINNIIDPDLNTGGNTADKNNGEVEIATGDINFALSLVNGPINTGSTKMVCCQDGNEDDQDGDGDGDGDNDTPGTGGNGEDSTPPSINDSSNGSSSGNGKGNGGSVLGALSDILPATGMAAHNNWLLLVVYLLMFLAGLYMRLRAGHSPDRRLAYRFTS